MNPGPWADLAAIAALAGLMAYAVLGGADFGGGVWDLFAGGPRKAAQRDAIRRAMGPVWEANHVWLIFVIVVLFTGFPRGYAALVTALFIPLHLALLGIMLRGAAFVFRGFAAGGPAAWSTAFGVVSLITPFLLGAAFGAATAGQIRADGAGGVFTTRAAAWLSPYCLGCGFLAVAVCAYLAAVYLCVETDGPLREDFRQRAIFAGTATAGLAGAALVLAFTEAPWFFEQMTRGRALPAFIVGLFFFAASAWAVWGRRYRLSRILAAGEIVVLLFGWGLAQWPWLIHPDFTLAATAAPAATLRFLLLLLPAGLVALVPSLWLLFAVFKRRN